jgi:hypothetical protein
LICETVGAFQAQADAAGVILTVEGADLPLIFARPSADASGIGEPDLERAALQPNGQCYPRPLWGG